MKKIIVIILIVILVLGGLFIYFNFIGKDEEKPDNNNTNTENNIINDNTSTNNREESQDNMQISIKNNQNEITIELNDSNASKELYNQLPLTIEVEDYSTNEKIFYPPNELDINNTPLATNGTSGTLAYYEPWGDVVIFYDSYTSASGLYELGQVTKGLDQIENLSGNITIEKIE